MSKKLEFLTMTAMVCPSVLDRIFSVMILVNTMKTDGTKIDFKAMTNLVLVLLNDDSVKLRTHAITLAQTIIDTQSGSGKEMNLFSQSTATKLTPMKPKSAIVLLQSIVKMSADIIQDNNQLRLCLSRFSKPEVYE
jgi:hypothetical protein